MALIYVTGAPGSGKTTLQKELSARGYETRDIDNSGLGGPYNKASGQQVVIPPADQRSPEWFAAHEWRVHPQAFTALKEEASGKDIILCGVAGSDSEILHVFDEILYLYLDDDTLIQRLQSRTDNDYGKNDFELSEILDRKHGLDAKYSDMKVIHIDATKSLRDVADTILAHVNARDGHNHV
jgi:broad-specificity NMP kinase